MTTAYEPMDRDGERVTASAEGAAGAAGPVGAEVPYGSQSYYGPEVPYGSQTSYGSMPPPPPPPPPGWGGGGSSGQGGGHHSGPPRRSHRRMLAMGAGVAVLALAGGGTAWAAGGSSTLSTAQIAARTDPGLVDVTSTLGYQHGTAEGTGMVLTSSGEVLTNNHVVAGSTSVSVRDIGNGKTYKAKVVGYSDSKDIAVLKMVGASGLSTVSVGNSSAVSSGQRVVALGNAGGKGGTPSVATGKVTGTDDTITAEDQGDGALEHLADMISTNADIQPGDSGGPLLNTAGQVIGMDTAASSSSSNGYGTTAAQSTTAFSIPINNALSVASQIEAGKSSSSVHIGATAFLGVEVNPPSAGSSPAQSGSGVVIVGALPGTAAAQAGISAGDTVLSVGGQQVTSSSDLQHVIEEYHPGSKVTVQWADQYGGTHSATVTLTAGPTG